MADAIKFSEEELKKITEVQTTYQQITMTFGSLKIQKLNIDKQELSLKEALDEARTNENDLAKELTEKYGKGSLDISTGEFTPEPEEATEVVEEAQ